MNKFFASSRVYLDYAAATPRDPAVAKEMAGYLSSLETFGNPSSTHDEGRRAKEALEEVRLKIARLLHAHADEIIFTSGATESDNLAIQGVVASSSLSHPHVISTAIEHSAIRETLQVLEQGGVSVTYLPVDENGLFTQEILEKHLRKETVLVTLSLGNSEIGTVLSPQKIAQTLKDFRVRKGIKAVLHLDASQSAGYVAIDAEALQADLVTIDSAKIYGPKGIGVLYARRGTDLKSIMYGGGQERGRRPGTESVLLAVGMAKALLIAENRRDRERSRLALLSKYFIDSIHMHIPNAVIHAEKLSVIGEKHRLPGRLPNFVNVCFPGVDAEFLTVRLDSQGIAASSASACRSIGGNGRSYVIEGLPGGASCASSSIRFSLGRYSNRHDIDHTIRVLVRLLAAH